MELARHLGCGNSTIGQVEKGNKAITQNLAVKLAAFFETTAEYWLDMDLEVEKLKDIRLGIELKEVLDDFKEFGVLTKPSDIFENKTIQKYILKTVENYLIAEQINNDEINND